MDSHKQRDALRVGELLIEDGELYLTQRQISECTGINPSNIQRSCIRAFRRGDLNEDATVKIYNRIVDNCKIYKIKHYSLTAVSCVVHKCRAERAKTIINTCIPKLKAMVAAGENSKVQKYFAEICNSTYRINKEEKNSVILPADKVLVEDGSIWLTTNQIADCLGAAPKNIGSSYKTAFQNEGLKEEINIKKHRRLSSDHKIYKTIHFSWKIIKFIAHNCRLRGAKEFIETHCHKLEDMVAAGKNIKAQKYFNDICKTAPKISDKSGYIYIISNELFSGWLKIGIAKNVKKRLSSYQTADLYRRFKVEYSKETKYCRAIEKYLHKKYENKYEWIKAPLKTVINEIENYKYPHSSEKDKG